MPRRVKVAQGLELLEELSSQDAPASSSNESSLSDEEDKDFFPGSESDSEDEDGDGEDVHEEVQIEREELGEEGNPGSWISKNGIIWSPLPFECRHVRPGQIRCPGITRYAITRIQNIEDSFSFFITDEIINIIVRHTNAEGIRKDKDWKDVDAIELRAYFGLLILAGVQRSRGEATDSLWGEEMGRPIFRATMSLKRFRALTSTLRFDDRLTRAARQKNNPDKLTPIQDIWDRWVARLPLGYSPDVELCVDEQLVSFRGCCNFRQYIPRKPGKYGLKMWVLCDVATTYVCGIIPYLGKKTPDAPAEKDQGKRVVLELTQGLSGHTVTTDNFFTSHALGEELLKQKICLVGTMRKNKPELPPQLLKMRGRQLLSSVFGFTSKTAVVSYIPRRNQNVVLLSTKHWQVQVSPEDHKKPTIVLDYNRCKGAVDNLDKLVSTYSCRRGTRRWTMALFGNMLDISAYNALVLWLAIDPRWCQKKHHRRRLFLQELGNCLVKPAMERRQYLPRTSGAAALVLAHREPEPEPEPAQDKTRAKKRCHLCQNSRSVFGRFCNKCGLAVCKEHSTAVCASCRK